MRQLTAPSLRSTQRTQKLSMAGASVRAQKAFALDYCAASFVTEGEAPHRAANPQAIVEKLGGREEGCQCPCVGLSFGGARGLEQKVRARQMVQQGRFLTSAPRVSELVGSRSRLERHAGTGSQNDVLDCCARRWKSCIDGREVLSMCVRRR